MKKVYLLFFGFILTYSINAQSKAENFAKKNTEKLIEVLQLTKTENVQVYDILLERENEFTVLRKKYKDDKNTLRAEIEKLHPIYNRKLKDILGKERMKKYHDYFKSKYNEYLKSKKNKSKDKKVPMAVASYYVSTKGEDSNPGTFNKPFKTILKASKKMKAGDICYIREGFYHEIITLNETHGTYTSPITFKAYKNENVVLDGTELIKTTWTKHEGNIYKAKIKKDIWQLFVDKKSMTSARWPNGNWYDGSVWDKTKSMAWPEKEKSSYGHHFNKGLALINQDLTGAIIIVNSGSFKTFKSNVIEHTPNTDNFKYDTKRKGIKVHFSYEGKVKKHGYFLEGKLGLLDEENEWFYNPINKTVYLWTPKGKHPKGLEIKGKTQSYAFDIQNSSHIKIEGINFFGTTFNTYESNHITVENCNFEYPSYSKRMLNDLSEINATSMIMRKFDSKAFNIVRNCKFEYMDGPVINMNGSNNIVENNYMHSIDYSCTYKGGYTINMLRSTDLLFRRNTVHTAGTSEMYKAGVRNTIELNNLSRSGYLQNDGSLIQISAKEQDQSQTRYNWVHNSVKQGLRYDNSNIPNSTWGENGNMHHNVAWKTNRIFFKGDKHFIYNNLSFDNRLNDLIVSSNLPIQGRNYETITRNNISNKFSGHRTKPGKDYPVPGIVDHNWSGNFKNADIRSQLRDPDNLDFRPKENSDLVDKGALIEGKEIPYLGKAPDIGAYEFGDLNYWIPGFQDKIASTPVPPTESKTVKTDADLMWLTAYKAYSSDIYIGGDFDTVKNASKNSPEFKGRQKNNIYSPGKLNAGKTYYWRIDEVTKNGTQKGNVWSFTVNY